MGYTVKWVTENLGITRDMLRYYEKEGLLPVSQNRNPANNYRTYNDEDIEKIWAIKLLIEIGFSAKEIYSFMNDPDFDFDRSLAQKVAELEQKHKEQATRLQFAKSIKVSGQIPIPTKIGRISFQDFLSYAHENWNFYNDPTIGACTNLIGILAEKEPQRLNSDEVIQIFEAIDSFGLEELLYSSVLHGYFQLLSNLREFGYDSDVVQKVVRLLHEYIVKNNPNPEMDELIINHRFALHLAAAFMGGDISVLHKRTYGTEGCIFIAQALVYYAGNKSEDQ